MLLEENWEVTVKLCYVSMRSSREQLRGGGIGAVVLAGVLNSGLRNFWRFGGGVWGASTDFGGGEVNKDVTLQNLPSESAISSRGTDFHTCDSSRTSGSIWKTATLNGKKARELQ